MNTYNLEGFGKTPLSEGGMGSVAGKRSFKCEFSGSSLTGVGDL